MKILAVVVAFILLAACVAGARPSSTSAAVAAMHAYPATDARVRVMGRHVADGSTVGFGASGVTFYLKFRGTALDADLTDERRDSTSHNWFTVVVDGGEPTRFRTAPGPRRYPLARGLANGVHTVALSKATEGQNGRQRLSAFYADALVQADPLPTRRIEFIGNSITSGYGLDPRDVPCGQGAWYDKTHAWLAFGPRVARAVNAQWMLSSVSGIGMLRNWDSPSPVMPDVYGGVYMEYADTASRWDFSRYVPDLVVVSLGTNDFSDGAGPRPRPALDGDAFVGNYVRFLAGLRSRYPKAHVVLASSPMLDTARNARLDALLARVVAERGAAGDADVTRFTWPHRYVAGCDGHPSLAEHARMAAELEPVVRARMGW